MIRFLIYASIIFTSSVTAGENLYSQDKLHLTQQTDCNEYCDITDNQDFPDLIVSGVYHFNSVNSPEVFSFEAPSFDNESTCCFKGIRAPPVL